MERVRGTGGGAGDEAHRKTTITVDGRVECRRPGGSQMLGGGAKERGGMGASYSLVSRQKGQGIVGIEDGGAISGDA